MRSARVPGGCARILFCERADSFGGSCVSLGRLLRGLDRSAYEPVVVVPLSHPGGDAFRAQGVEVIEFWPAPSSSAAGSTRDIAGRLRSVHHSLGASYRVARQSWRFVRHDLVAAGRLLKLLRKRNVSLVHHNDGLARNRDSVLAASWAGLPQVCHVRAFEQLSWVDRLIAGVVRRFVYVSRAVAEHCRRQGIPSVRGEVVYNPIEWSRPSGFGPNEVRSEFGWDGRHRVVTNVGRITRWKGQDVFLRAFAEAHRADSRCRALIVGDVEASPLDREYDQTLQRMVAELGLVGDVVFTGFRNDVPSILAASDVVVHCPTEPEPFGLVVMEALAAARPVVGADGGGIPEMIEDGVTGILVPPRDSGAVARAVLGLLQDPGRAADLGRWGQARMREMCSIERHTAAVQGIYAACLSGAGTPSAVRRGIGS